MPIGYYKGNLYIVERHGDKGHVTRQANAIWDVSSGASRFQADFCRRPPERGSHETLPLILALSLAILAGPLRAQPRRPRRARSCGRILWIEGKRRWT
jgi:hypothetical protein